MVISHRATLTTDRLSGDQKDALGFSLAADLAAR